MVFEERIAVGDYWKGMEGKKEGLERETGTCFVGKEAGAMGWGLARVKREGGEGSESGKRQEEGTGREREKPRK
jgi:hypothetical protein